jgi:hypothetical protein
MSSRERANRLARWVDEAPGEGFDQQLGEIFRAVPDETPLEPAALASVGRRIAGERRSPTRRTFYRLPLVLAVVVGGAGAALAQWGRPSFSHLRRYLAPPVLDAPRAAPPRSPEVGVAPGAREEPIEPERAIATVAVEAPPGAIAAKGATPRASPIALESQLLERAFGKLRRDHDAAGALALLDDYEQRFPRGTLSIEASVARVDALLLLRRRDEALGCLVRLPLERVARGVELQLVRAELHAERDCSRALPDFDAVLAASDRKALAERALYGRAGCRLRMGDTTGGRSDLETYLSRYPSGRFVEQVRARLTVP